MQIGDKIRFGRYDWRVLDIQNDMALIITDEIIEQRVYHDAYDHWHRAQNCRKLKK